MTETETAGRFSGTILFVIGLVLGFGLGAAAATFYQATARPRVQVAELFHEFEPATEDQERRHTFVIKNTGRRPLQITNVKADCACTATDYPKVIPPGGQGKLTLAIKPLTTQGAFAKKTTVSLNDPDRPQVVFTLKGVNLPLIEVKPGNVIRFQGKAGEAAPQQVRLSGNLPEPWEIKEVKLIPPEFAAVEVKTEEAGKSYVLEVRPTRQEPGKYQGRIDIRTTLPKKPQVLLRVFGEVLPPAAAPPSPPGPPSPPSP